MIPREIIFGNPERLSPMISPDGQRLAYIAPSDGVLNVWVKTVGKNDDYPITNDRGTGIRGYFWAWNNKHILFVQDKDGDENWHLFKIPAEGGDPFDLTPINGIQARVISIKKEYPDTILVGINDRVPQLHDIYKIDLRTGERVLELKNDIGAIGYYADQKMIVRLAQIPLPDGGFALLHRDDSESEWSQLMNWANEDSLSTGVTGFAKDNQTIFMISSIGSNSAQLRSYNIQTAEEKVILSDPTYDIASLFVNPFTREIQAAAFEKERLEWHVLDPKIKGDFDGLRHMNEGDFHIVNRDAADKIWLVAYSTDDKSTAYYIWDSQKKYGMFLFSGRAELDKFDLCKMKPVKYKARDGLTIHGYLSLPINVKPQRLPAILLIHGGPWVRDSWGYNPEAQWLANRGYAVLQINYRASTGYGKEFVNAGDKEWGGKMQDDITDAVHWLINEGLADPRRIGMYGGSYGGFATLSALTKTPNLFACGIDIVGPSNLITFQKTIPPYWEPLKPNMYKRIGHPEEDRELLEERSPINHINRIQSPLMIVQGANDPRVKREESIQIRDALVKANKTIEYMEFADEGHGFSRPENRFKFYAAAEKFLAKHLGGQYLE